MEFGVLGTLLVRANRADVPITGAKLRALLAALLLQANRTVSQEALVEVVWDGHPPPEALGTLRSYIMRLRRTLGEAGDRVVTRPSGYAIEVEDGEFDLRRFQDARARAREYAAAGDWSAVSATLTGALALWRGEPLADVPVQESLRDDIGALVEERLQATHQRIAADIELGRHEDVLAELRELTARHPLHELFRGQFMLALYRSGRQAEALAAYRAARRLLIEELGVEPTPQLQTLHERILAADPALAAPEPQAPTAGASERPGPGERSVAEYVVPRQLPRAIEHFSGRTDELATLTKLMSGTERSPGTVVISAVAGTGGVGKTALAVHWAHQHADRYPDGQLYVNLQGYDPRRPPLAPEQSMRGFLDALGVPPARVPMGLDAQAALYRSLVAERRMLILLDNAADAEQVRPLLPGGPDCMVLITSRNRLTSLVAAEGARPVPLDILTTGEARDLLTVRLGAQAVQRERAAADELIELCARLPLALNIAASLAAFHDRAALSELAAGLREQRARLDTLNAGDPTTDVRAVFACSYQALSPEAASLFRSLGLHTGTDFTVEVAAALAGLPVRSARRLLTELTASSLVAEYESERFALHDLLRAYALEQCEAQDPAAGRREATERMLGWYLGAVGAVAAAIDPQFPMVSRPSRPGTPDPLDLGDVAEALAWADVERHNLRSVVAHAVEHGHEEYAWKLAVTLQHYYNRACRWDDWQATHQEALDAASRIGDDNARGLLLQSLGWLYTRTRRVDQGIQCLTESAELLRAAGDRYGVAMTTSHLGNAHMMLGQWEQGAERFRSVIEVDRKIGYRRGEGIAVSNLSVCLQYLERWEEADEQARLAYAVNDEVGNRSSQAIALLTLRYVAVWRGDIPGAFAHVDEALRLRREIGDRFGEACVLEELARTHLAAGDTANAIGALTESARIFDDLDPRWAASHRDWMDELRAGQRKAGGAE